MKKNHLMILLGVIFVLSIGVDAKSTFDIDTKLMLLNKPALKTIHSEDGDIIDCVDIYKQPAFDHPVLKIHTIQMKPSREIPVDTRKPINASYDLVESQTWRKSGSCPDGTVPIRRIRKQDLLRAASLDRFGRRFPQASTSTNTTDRFVTLNGTQVDLGRRENHSTATLVTLGYNYIGAKADLNVWNPKVEADNEYTTTQVWLTAGPGDNWECVEAGWAVNPHLYGDRRTRLFGYWTVDSSKSTGCFDLSCSGFVQTSKEVVLGAAIDGVSSRWGQQYYITVGIYMDPSTGNWWLHYGKDKVVGYWPATIFGYLKHSAIIVEWGGEVYSTKIRKEHPHTATEMGSGSFATGLYGFANYVMYPRIIDYSQQLKYPEWVGTYTTETDCYSAINYIKSYAYEPVFYFGGPGRNQFCP